MLRQTFAALAQALLLSCIISGCTDVPQEAAFSDAGVGVTTQAINPTNPSDLAQPALDLTAPITTRWLTSATPAGIESVVSNGYRLHRLEIAEPTSPPRFAALLVKNEGDYERSGTGWEYGIDRTQLDAIIDDPDRRLIDVAPYLGAAEARFGAVWVSNTGDQQEDTRVLLEAADVNEIESEAAAFNGRVTDLDYYEAVADEMCFWGFCFPIAWEFRFSAVMVKNVGPDYRQQWLGSGAQADIESTLQTNDARLTAIEADPASPDNNFFYVAEEMYPDERTWWYDGLQHFGMPHVDPQNIDHADNLATVQLRLGGRFTELKPYQVDGETRYLAILQKNRSMPQRGPSNNGNATLQAIDDVMRDAVRRYGLPGATLAVAEGNRLVHTQGYGYSHLAFGSDGAARPTTPRTTSRVASVSKTITGMAILKLIEEGATFSHATSTADATLELDTQVFGAIFPPPEGDADADLAQVQIRHLLTHRSGFVSDLEDQLKDGDPTPGNDGWQATDWFSVNNVMKGGGVSPGDDEDYQNLNYYLLGLVIEEITGKSYAQYVRDALLFPLEIDRIHVTADRPQLFTSTDPQEAAGYAAPSDFRRRYGLNAQDAGNNETAKIASGGWAASPVDLLRLWMSADGSKDGVRVLNNSSYSSIRGSASNTPGDIQLASLKLLQTAGGVLYLNKGGLVPDNGNAGLMMRDDGIKFAWTVNSDEEQVPSKKTVFDFIRDRLNDIFDNQTLPNRDLFEDFGFSARPCPPDFHKFPANRFQHCFDYWAGRNMFPVTLSAAMRNGEQVVSGSFQDVPSRFTRLSMTQAQYDMNNQNQINLGRRPEQLSIVNTPNGRRFTAFWVPATGDVESHYDMTQQEFADRWSQLRQQNYLTTDLLVYQDTAGNKRFAATWDQQSFDGYATYFGLTRSQFISRSGELHQQGMELTHVVGYDVGNGQRYAGIWEKTNAYWNYDIGLNASEYQDRYEHRKADGYELRHIHSDGQLFHATWLR